MMDVNSGYIGHSMSRRAAEAYEDGEMPKSKWTKKAMVAAIQSYCDEFDMSFDPDVLKGMRKDEVFERFFHESTALRMFMPSGKTTTVSAARSFLTNASSKRRTYPKS